MGSTARWMTAGSPVSTDRAQASHSGVLLAFEARRVGVSEPHKDEGQKEATHTEQRRRKQGRDTTQGRKHRAKQTHPTKRT